MFLDGFSFGGRESLGEFGFSANFRAGGTAANLTRSNLSAPSASFGRNERVNLSSNLGSREIATSKTFGFCQDAARQIYEIKFNPAAQGKFDQMRSNLAANEANSSGLSSGKFDKNGAQKGAAANLNEQAKFNENAQFGGARKTEQTREKTVNLTQIKTVDIHSHLLSGEVKFDRFYDKLALAFFAKKFDINRRELVQNGFEGYKSNFARLIRSSNFVQKSVVFGVDAKFDASGNLVHKDKTVCAANEEVFAFYEQNPCEVVPFF